MELVRDGVLDAELAALLWLLLDARLPVVVVGRRGSGRNTLVAALLELLPAESRATRLAGAAEEFEWLPEAPELGWRRASHAARVGARSPNAVRAADTVLLVTGLGDGPPHGTPGPQARIAIRALSLGYGMAATMAGDGLEDVFATLHAPPVGADDDELSRLGIVLAMKRVPAAEAGGVEAVPVDGPTREAGVGEAGPGDGRSGEAPSSDPDPALHRVVAAHYVRPVVRDAHGHVQRLPPAVLAAWESRTDRLEHFAWGIVGELAGRTGLRAAEFEREQARRASYLAGLASAGLSDPDDVRTAIAGYREAAGSRPD